MKCLVFVLLCLISVSCVSVANSSRYERSGLIIEIDENKKSIRMGELENGVLMLGVVGKLIPTDNGYTIHVVSTETCKIKEGDIVGSVKINHNTQSITIVDQSGDGHVFNMIE
jgi:hypothetical protein